jgi:hypothetical protein
MTTGQTLLAMGALVLLTMIMLNFYRIFGSSWDTLDSSQLGIDATTIGTSFMELVHGLAFDERTDTSFLQTGEENLLTSTANLGPEGSHDDSLHKFNDFDDFHGHTATVNIGDNRVYMVEFDVYYVNPTDVTTMVNNRTFTKRMDMKIWREQPPPPPNAGIDTVSMWTVMGYFSFL